jgi:Transcriptional regulator
MRATAGVQVASVRITASNAERNAEGETREGRWVVVAMVCMGKRSGGEGGFEAEEGAAPGVAEGAFEAGDEAGGGDDEAEFDEAVAAEVGDEALAEERVVVALGEAAGEVVDVGERGWEGGGVFGDDGAEEGRRNAVAAGEGDGDLRAGAAVLGEGGGDAGDVPGVEREEAAVGAEGGEEGELEKRGGRAVGDVAEVIEGRVEDAFLTADESVEEGADHGGGGGRRGYRACARSGNIVLVGLPYLSGMAVMELRHLRYFVAVAEEQNITRAARRLNVSQPPLSRQIRDLEDELGTPLLERGQRSVRLTPAGWAFLEECYPVLRQVEQAAKAARAAGQGGCGELKLGYAPGPTQEFLPKLLRQLRGAKKAPCVELHDLTTAEMLTEVRAGRLDAALAVLPREGEMRGLVFERLKVYPWVVVMAWEHALAKRKSIRASELAGEPLVVLSRREYPEHAEVLEAMVGKGRRLRFGVECDSGASLIAAVEAGQGVSVVATSLRPTIGARLATVPLRGAPAGNVIGVLHRKDAGAEVKRMLEAARVVAGEGSRRAAEGGSRGVRAIHGSAGTMSFMNHEGTRRHTKERRS